MEGGGFSGRSHQLLLVGFYDWGRASRIVTRPGTSRRGTGNMGQVNGRRLQVQRMEWRACKLTESSCRGEVESVVGKLRNRPHGVSLCRDGVSC